MSALEKVRACAIFAVGLCVLVALGASTYESFNGLRDWALAHDLPGTGSLLFPGVIDSFPLMGDFALFVAMLDHKTARERRVPWAVISGGLVVSVGLQVGNVSAAGLATQLTHALFPLAALGATMLGAQLFESVLAEPAGAEEGGDEEEREQAPEDPLRALARVRLAEDIRRGHVTGISRIKSQCKVGHDKARRIQAHARDLVAAA